MTKDAQEVRRFLAPNKGMVITNTTGDREGYTGVFSNSVHHTVLTDLEGEFVRVLDPMYRDGRYDSVACTTQATRKRAKQAKMKRKKNLSLFCKFSVRTDI